MNATPTDLSFDSGFMYCRLAGVDESSGTEVVVPGVYARFRCSRMNTYLKADESTVEVYIDGCKDPFEIFTTLAAVDKIMRRANLVEVGAPQETPVAPKSPPTPETTADEPA